jgi:hypothetical protein
VFSCAGKLLLRMIEDMTRLAVDPLFPPPASMQRPPTPTSSVASTPIAELEAIAAGSAAGVSAGAGAGASDGAAAPPVAHTAAVPPSKSTRENGFELLYTEQSEAARHRTQHHQQIAPHGVIAASLLPTPSGATCAACVGVCACASAQSRVCKCWDPSCVHTTFSLLFLWCTAASDASEAPPDLGTTSSAFHCLFASRRLHDGV